MTLYDISEANRRLFYEQSWFCGEAFMNIEADTTVTRPPGLIRGVQPESMAIAFQGKTLQHAATWAWLYVQDPGDKLWESFLWTKDFDHLGQRIYVGGVNQGTPKGFQIHRHLQITNLWAVPIWE